MARGRFEPRLRAGGFRRRDSWQIWDRVSGTWSTAAYVGGGLVQAHAIATEMNEAEQARLYRYATSAGDTVTLPDSEFEARADRAREEWEALLREENGE